MDYTSIKLEKGFYNAPEGFSKKLEELDPSENYRGTYLEGTDAFRRQLKRFGIHTAGKNSDRVEKFFIGDEPSVLFPEYVRRSVIAGMEKNAILPNIVASVTNINSMDYRAFRSIQNDDVLELETAEEGKELPSGKEFVISSKNVELQKRGKLITASYEALRFQRLDVFSVMLAQIGAQIAKTQLKDALEVILDGGNEASTEQSGTLTYSDLVHFWNGFDPYNMDVIVCSPDVLEKILNMAPFMDSNAAQNFHGSGKMVTPFGTKLFKSSVLESGTLIGLDSSCALEQVQAGDVLVEFDRLISNQTERAAISTISAFSPVFPDAAKVLKI